MSDLDNSRKARAGQFPANEGWIRATFTMTTKTPLGVDRIKQLATCGGNADGYEFGKMEQYGAKIVVIYRQKRAEAAA